MTQEAPRWCMEPVDPHEGRLVDGKGGYFCGLLLVPTEGPCVTCGCVEDGAVVHAQDKTGTWYCIRCASRSNLPMREHAHQYQPPVSCPVHSAAPDRGEA